MSDMPFKNLVLSPAHLWIGPSTLIETNVVVNLQTYFCSSRGCGRCSICAAVASREYHAVTWIMPEKGYTLDTLDVLFDTLAFMLESEKHHFFIILKADLLTSACANRLLKPLEEPPLGYHFILCAERIDDVLPTVRSRCIIRQVHGVANRNEFDELFHYFSSSRSNNAADFLKVLEQSKISEHESLNLLDRLLAHWLAEGKNALCSGLQHQYGQAERMMSILKEAYKYLPMPGSSKLFWKDLFLQITVP